MLFALLASVGAFLAAVLLTPMFRKLAIRCKVVDAPDALRKLHRESIALCGGPVILASTFLAALVAILVVPEIALAAQVRFVPLAGLITAAISIVVLGVCDDRFGIRGRQKLAGQVLIASVLVFSGYRIDLIGLFGSEFQLGIFAYPISVCWLLLTINSINLIDGADGLCCSVGWIASAGFAAMAAHQGHYLEATCAATIAGALLGFLVYNFPPAKVFLGDSGSMLIGLMLGALAMRTSLKGPTAVSILGAVSVLALPFFDSSMAIVRRKLTGRSIFSTDRGHLHHNLITKGFEQSRLVVLISIFSGILACGAFMSVVFNNEFMALIALLVVLGCLIANRLFGYAELSLLANRILHFGNTLMPRRAGNSSGNQHQKYRLQGGRSWETIWDSIVEFADKHDLSKVTLDLNVPWMHEGYHACWNREKGPEESKRWKMVMPIFAGTKSLGRIEFCGPVEAGEGVMLLESLAVLIESVQHRVVLINGEYELEMADQAATRTRASEPVLMNVSIDAVSSHSSAYRT